jgi:hypothetical protein
MLLQYDAYLSSSLSTKENLNELYSVVTNLSHSGMSIITKGYMEIGDKINMSIYLSGDNVISFYVKSNGAMLFGQ